MASTIDTRLARRLSARLAVGLALSAVFAAAAIVGTANAQPRWEGNSYHNWNGGHYRAPPVVYGSPYGQSYYGSTYRQPPVVYGPGVGLNIQIR
jgi:hypothetical protein